MTPLYAAGEKKIKFNQVRFAQLISKNSNTQVILVKNEVELTKFLKKSFKQ